MFNSYGLSAADIELAYRVVERITGTCQQGANRREIILSKISRRMEATKCKAFKKYLDLIDKDANEKAIFISSITIHTTSWYRERLHFDWIIKNFSEKFSTGSHKVKILILACSTGEEVYTTATIFEEFRSKNIGFDYSIEGVDIDPISVKQAQGAIYKMSSSFDSIPLKYRKNFLVGSGVSNGYFTLSKEIRKRCSFHTSNIDLYLSSCAKKYDLVMCRNLIIYFNKPKVKEVIRSIKRSLSPGGHLILGASEAIDYKQFGLMSHGGSIYQHIDDPKKSSNIKKENKRTILVVDDSKSVRLVLSDLLKKNGYEIICAENADEATKQVAQNKIDLITLDLNMPNVDGVAWLKSYRAKGGEIPVIVISDHIENNAKSIISLVLENLAQECLAKTEIRNNPHKLISNIKSLIIKDSHDGDNLKDNGATDIENRNINLVLVGASTGGPKSLQELFSNMPSNFPPIVLVQHLSATFGKAFSEGMCEKSGLKLGKCLMEKDWSEVIFI